MTRAKDISKILTDADISGTLDVTGETTLATHLNLGDNDKIKLGTSQDLELYHDGNDSNIADVGTGTLLLKTDGAGIYLQKGSSETLAQFKTDGAVNLYYDNSKKFETTSSGVTVTGAITGTSTTLTGGITASSFNGGQLGGRRNLLINGSMNVAQRSASVSGIGASAGYFTCDRWKVEIGSTAGRFTMSQTADAPNGVSANCLKLDCTTADTSIADAEYLFLANNFEGQDIQGIGKGITGAKEVTVSFYVKASAVFNFVVEFQDRDNSRKNGRIFATTTDWVRHEITFQADVDDGSSPFDDDNSASARVNFWLHAGSTYTSGTLGSDWENINQANRAVGISSFFSSTDNNFFLTGVQVEIGSVATPFEHRSFGEELGLCQRYFIKDETDYKAFTDSNTDGGSKAVNFTFPTVMRTLPTMTASADAGNVVFSHRRDSGVAVTIGGAVNARSFINGGYQADAEL